MTGHLPLAGSRILVTRPRGQADQLRARLAALGAAVVEAPAIRIERTAEAPVDAALRSLDRYAWVVLTSVNGVRVLADRLRALGRSSAELHRLRVAAIGPATARALRNEGVQVDIIPAGRFDAEGLLEAVRPLVHSGERILLLRAAEARPVLPDGLRALGAVVEEVTAYRAVAGGFDAAGVRGALVDGEIDAVTFTSGSGVRHFTGLVGSGPLTGPRRPRIVCLGPVTAEAALAAGLPVDRVADQATNESLVAAVVDALREREGVR